jgi:hypothetical protein
LLSPNVPIQRIVDILPATCPNNKIGCKAALTRGIINDHIERTCLFQAVRCPLGCEKVLLRKEYARHKLVCIYRSIVCKFCKQNVTWKEEPVHIAQECLHALRACFYCKEIITFETSGKHLVYDCKSIELTCPSSKFGCTFVGKQAEYNAHMIAFAKEHVAQAERHFTRRY